MEEDGIMLTGHPNESTLIKILVDLLVRDNGYFPSANVKRRYAAALKELIPSIDEVMVAQEQFQYFLHGTHDKFLS